MVAAMAAVMGHLLMPTPPRIDLAQTLPYFNGRVTAFPARDVIVITWLRRRGDIAMAAVRWFIPLLALALVVAGSLARAQTLAPPNPAEQKAYAAAAATKDPTKRAQAMEVFIAWYPNSPLRIEAHEQAMAAWQAASNPAKADAIAVRLLQIDPDNLRGLANRVYVGRARAAAGEAGALAPAVAAAERGLSVLNKWQRPPSATDTEFVRTKLQFMAVFDGALGFAALQAKDYAKAKHYYIEAVTIDPDNLQDAYQLSVAQLEGSPLDPLGFWYAARAMAIARTVRNTAAATEIEKYARSRYQRYHGSEEGWDQVVASAETQRMPPEGFAGSISRALTGAEHAVQLMSDNDPSTLSYADWAFVLAHRDESSDNQAAAEKMWKTILDKQKGGASRLKMPIKVVSATPDRIEAAFIERNQTANRVDIEVMLARPLNPLPAVGATISVVGTIRDYRVRPFAFVMSNAELSPESLPIAGGPCADPRPQMCTREYRPACGLRRDGSRKSYGNACTACADADVVSQAAGPCP
jgi:tetratricopeptide (TPR) repeat protein